MHRYFPAPMLGIVAEARHENLPAHAQAHRLIAQLALLTVPRTSECDVIKHSNDYKIRVQPNDTYETSASYS